MNNDPPHSLSPSKASKIGIEVDFGIHAYLNGLIVLFASCLMLLSDTSFVRSFVCSFRDK